MSVGGLLMSEELKKINEFKSNFIKVGGIKIKDKIKILKKIRFKSFVGGGIALSILRKLGYEVGSKSKYEILEDNEIIKRSLIILVKIQMIFFFLVIS